MSYFVLLFFKTQKVCFGVVQGTPHPLFKLGDSKHSSNKMRPIINQWGKSGLLHYDFYGLSGLLPSLAPSSITGTPSPPQI